MNDKEQDRRRTSLNFTSDTSFLVLPPSPSSPFTLPFFLSSSPLLLSYRPIILRELQGHVLRLLLHREASGVLADTFELYANAYERSILLRDFYGKEASLFTVTAGSEEEKERSKRGLRGLMEGLEGDRRKRILAALKDNLVTM